jgi:tetratricopeptide (TPR) repeat protein
MKRLVLSFFCLFAGIMMSSAQQSNVQSANRSLSFDPLKYSDLVNAKTSIDLASENETTKNDPKMWYYRGKVYNKIAGNQEAREKNLDPEAIEKAVVSFVNCIKTDTKKNYYDETKSLVWQSTITLFNKAVNTYSTGDPKAAIRMYEIIFDVFPLDVDNNLKRNNITQEILYKNIYFAAKKAGDKATAEANVRKLIDVRFNDPNIYLWMSDMQLEKSDTAAAISTVESGLSVFDDYPKLISRQISLYLMSGKTEVLIGKLAESIEAAPDNEVLYLIRGELYEQKQDYSKASADYSKALEINPDNLTANYDMGTMVFNQAAEIVKKAQQTTNNAEYEKLEKEYQAKFQLAEKYLDKAREVNPKKTEDELAKYKVTLQSLRQLYARTNRLDKANEMKGELEKL